MALYDGPTPARVIERALSKITPAGDCWHSTYSIGSHGYPQIGWNDAGKTTMRLVHRVTWESANGPIPAGMTIDHVRQLCGGPPCVRPDHLRLLTNHDNARRTNGRDWPLGECAHGHPDSELVAVGKAGKLVCRICRRKWNRDYRERRAA